MTTSRRQFFKAAAGLAAAASHPLGVPFNAGLGIGLAGLGALAAQRSLAADSSGYKALVCLFFAGGSDQHNWVVPADATSYAQYAQVRRELAWPEGRAAANHQQHAGQRPRFCHATAAAAHPAAV